MIAANASKEDAGMNGYQQAMTPKIAKMRRNPHETHTSNPRCSLR